MNIRSLIKLNGFKLDVNRPRDTTNKYSHRLEIYHGDTEYPYHECASFTKDEFDNWLRNVSKIYNAIVEQLKNEQKAKET